MFIDKHDNKPLQTQILKVLKKLNEFIPDMVGPQFFQNALFPPALVKYIVDTKFDDLAGDSFILLINIFNEKNSPDIYTNEFVEKI